MSDLISRQTVIDMVKGWKLNQHIMNEEDALDDVNALPSAQPEQPGQPPYVAEIEAEYQKAVNMPYIKKPLAKALYEVWKKHDREDAERRTDEQTKD